jgi:acyl carrier protein
MVPSAFVLLDALPLNANGKVDRAALPSPDQACTRSSEVPAAPRNPIEEEVAKIFAEVLRREQVGIQDNFFDLGGHSMPAMRVAMRLRDAFQIELPVRKLFEAPTVASLSELIVQDLLSGASAEEMVLMLDAKPTDGRPWTWKG